MKVLGSFRIDDCLSFQCYVLKESSIVGAGL